MILGEIRGDFERLGMGILEETRDTGVAGVNIATFYSQSIVNHFFLNFPIYIPILSKK